MAQRTDKPAAAATDDTAATLAQLEQANGELAEQLGAAQAEVERLRSLLDAPQARRVSPDDELRRTRRALEITALVELHAAGKALGVADERAVTAALRLGAELCDEVEGAPLAPSALAPAG